MVGYFPPPSPARRLDAFSSSTETYEAYGDIVRCRFICVVTISMIRIDVNAFDIYSARRVVLIRLSRSPQRKETSTFSTVFPVICLPTPLPVFLVGGRCISRYDSESSISSTLVARPVVTVTLFLFSDGFDDRIFLAVG